jgi:Tfp pilus assembly protein PilV
MNQRGFTLVETIFSTLFIGIAVLAIVNLFPAAYLSIRKSEMQIQADIIAKSVLDDLRLVPFQLLDTNFTAPLDVEPYKERVIEGITYRSEVEIYEVPGSKFDFLKGVRVTVKYVNLNDLHRQDIFTKTYVLETYLHKLIR